MVEGTPIREVTLRLPMLPDMEIEASNAATSMAEEMRMSPDKVDEVRMAVVEACINAFEHSNATDGELLLSVAMLGEGRPERLCVTVRDNGSGFLPENMKTRSIERAIKSKNKRGWGLTIIRGLMDEVKIHSGAHGTTVVMYKSR